MTNVSYSTQTVQVQNPFVPLAQARLVTGAILVLPAGLCLARIQPLLSRAFLTGQISSPPTLILLLLGVASAMWLAWGVTDLVSGLRMLGPRLIVPPRTPVDLTNINMVAAVLERQEFHDLRLPTDGVLGWIQRFQRDRVFYATPREAVLLRENVDWVMKVLAVVAASSVVLFFALPLLRSLLPAEVIGPLGGIVLALLVAATLRGLAIPMLLTKDVPVANRDEHTRMVRGGGDPASLQPMVEQEFLRLREGDTPNRVLREMNTSHGTVADTGQYAARMYVETQPLTEAPGASPLTTLFLGGGIGFTAVGMAAAIVGLLSGHLPALLGGTLVALVWTAIGRGLVASGRVHLSRFRYTSTLAYLRAEGTIGRSEVKAGKGWNDSFESANLVVRSDSTMRLYTAVLTTETYALNGRRYILRAERDAKSDQAMQVVNGAVDDYERAGIVVRPIESTDSGLNQVAQANLAYRQATVALDAAPATPLLEAPRESAPTFQIEAHTPAPQPAALPTSAGETKECPMCAETIKAAARKCRFCGHLFDA